MEIDREAIGMRIHSIRREKGLTLEEFGEKIDGASKSVVSKWERGITLPNNKRIKIISEIARISVFQLLYGSGSSYVFNNLEKLLPYDEIKFFKVVSMASMQYLGEKIEREIETPTDFEGIKQLVDREYPTLKGFFMDHTDDLLGDIRVNSQLIDQVTDHLLENATPGNSDDICYIFKRNIELSFGERVKLLPTIEDIISILYLIIDEEPHFTDSHAFVLKESEIIKCIGELNPNKDELDTKYLYYKIPAKVQPLHLKKYHLLINMDESNDNSFFNGFTQLLVKYFPKFEHSFLKKYYTDSHMVVIDDGKLFVGYLNEQLILKVILKDELINIDLSTPKKERYYLPLLAIFY